VDASDHRHAQNGFPAFGHGDFRMLFPSNNKVLAFTRTYETQTILVVINLARFYPSG